MSELRLMAVHAHPDDESSKGAATLARYADEGYRVLVVTLTGGERGDILNPAMDLPEVHGRIADVRRDEMAKAAEILGVEHTWLGFVDSGLPQGDPPPPLPEDCFALAPLEVSTEALVRVVREFRPHVMTTYDENGGYPHPDHIRCHQVSVAAYEAAGDYRRFPDAGPVGRCQAVLQPRIPAAADADAAGRVRQARADRPVREVARALGSRARRPRRPGDDARRVLGVLQSARRRAARARHPDRSQGRFLRRADRMAAAAVADRGIRAGPLAGSGAAARDRPVRRNRGRP